MAKRTTIEIDEELLAKAQAALGTLGLKATVDRALAEAVRASLRRRLAERLATADGLDFSPEVQKAARSWRT